MPLSVLTFPNDDGRSPRDPDAMCDRCGNRGTAVRVTSHLAPPVITRYCSPCWRAVRVDVSPSVPLASPSAEEALAFLARVQGPPVTIVSRSWDDTLDFIGVLSHASRVTRYESPSALDAYRVEIAAEIVSGAADMDGPMPVEVRSFVDQYHRPSP